jgi:hypothetical protein
LWDIAEYLEEEEIPILIENTTTLQKRAFLACLYESGIINSYVRIINRRKKTTTTITTASTK